MDTTLQALIDRAAITDQLYRYCRSVDRLDVPLGHALWHEDALADYGDIYQGPGRGVIDFICEAHLLLLHHSHQISNILIALNGDRAGSEAYVTATLRLQDQDQVKQMTVWGRYIDEWSRRDDGWKLDQRQTIIGRSARVTGTFSALFHPQSLRDLPNLSTVCLSVFF